LDRLLGGGITSGSSTLIIGPAGTGKSLLIFQYIAAAVARGERAGLFAFEEELGLLFARAKGMGIDLEAMRDAGKLFVEQMDAAELSPGEFSHRVRACVDREGIRLVAIDSLNGTQLDGRTLTVNEAKPMAKRDSLNSATPTSSPMRTICARRPRSERAERQSSSWISLLC